MWKSENKSEMMLIFGGRGLRGQCHNDLWGLRRHKDGNWDWTNADYKKN